MVNYFGVNLDSKILITLYKEDMKKKTYGLMRIIYPLFQKHTGMSKKNKRKIYLTIHLTTVLTCRYEERNNTVYSSLNKLKKKTHGLMRIIYLLFQKHTEISKKNKRTIYLSTIRSVLTYGCKERNNTRDFSLNKLKDYLRMLPTAIGKELVLMDRANFLFSK